jgi:hypothetical protein
MRRSVKGLAADPDAAAARRRTHRRATAPASKINLLGVLMYLANASAPVTDDAGRFGSATVRRLAQKGAKVVIADVSDDRGEALASVGILWTLPMENHAPVSRGKFSVPLYE